MARRRGADGGVGGVLFGFCIYKYFPYGGIQRDLRKIVAACGARGHRSRVYALQWEGPAPDDLELLLCRRKR